jgi:hypothetical protein
MAKIPMWLIGRGVYTLFITPCSLQSNGTLTELTGGNLIGRCDEVSISGRNTLENISPMDSRLANNVVVESETVINLTEIMQSLGQANIDNVLALSAMQYDYVRVDIGRNGKTYTFYGVVGEYNENLRKGKCTATLSLHQVNLTNGINGMASPTYYSNPTFGNA